MDELGWKRFEMATIVTKYKPYRAYRPSGVGWLGDIPTHWDAHRLRDTVLGAQNGVWGTEPTGIDDIACVRVADFERVSFRAKIDNPTYRSIEVADIRARGLYPGDLLLEVSGGGEKQPVGATVLFEGEQPAVCSNFVARMRPSVGFEPRFLTYLHSTLYSFRVNVRSIKQSIGIQNLDKASYLNEVVGIPPLPEQKTIAGFLDRETAKIDSLVATKERLIELLQEKRTALISRAVTKGLDPDVLIKDSGVEWLGEIPAHWNVAPVYARYEVALGKMLDAKRITGDSLGPYVRNVDVQWDSVNTRNLPEMDFPPRERDRYRLQPGDLLVCEGGEVGRTAIWQGVIEECFYQKAIHRVRPRSQWDVPRFFYYMMCSLAWRGVFVTEGNPNTISHLTAVQLRHHRVVFPPLSEQRAISDHLDSETATIDALVSKVREAIDRLKELRTSLISAAVTGKIDVRGEVA